jgi:hypothetical protein
MGWCGWTEQQTLDTAIPAIETAFEGRKEMLLAMHGASLRSTVADAMLGEAPPAADVMAAFRTAARAK